MSRFPASPGAPGNGAPAPPPQQQRFQLDPNTKLEAAIDEETQLVQFSARGQFDIRARTIVIPFAYVETVFHSLLGLRLNRTVQRSGNVPGAPGSTEPT